MEVSEKLSRDDETWEDDLQMRTGDRDSPRGDERGLCAARRRHYRARARQLLLARVRWRLGADLADVASGRVAVAVPIEPRLPAGWLPPRRGRCRCARQRLRLRSADYEVPSEAEVLTVELKINLLAPASSDRLVAEGEVVRAGRTLTVCRGDAHAEQGADRVHVATMLATMVRRYPMNLSQKLNTGGRRPRPWRPTAREDWKAGRLPALEAVEPRASCENRAESQAAPARFHEEDEVEADRCRSVRE